MTEPNQVDAEEVREKKEIRKPNTAVTLESLSVSPVHLLQLLEGGGLLERTENGRGNAEGEHKYQGKRNTQDH